MLIPAMMGISFYRADVNYLCLFYFIFSKKSEYNVPQKVRNGYQISLALWLSEQNYKLHTM